MDTFDIYLLLGRMKKDIGFVENKLKSLELE